MKKFSTILFLLILAINISAQDVYTIETTKPGKVEKVLRKVNLGALIKLKIIGYIDENDIDALKHCVNLEYLDVSEAHIMDSKNKTPLHSFDIADLSSLRTLVFFTDESIAKLKSATYKAVANNIDDYVNAHITSSIKYHYYLENLYCSCYTADVLNHDNIDRNENEIDFKNIFIFDSPEGLIANEKKGDRDKTRCEKLVFKPKNLSYGKTGHRIYNVNPNCVYYEKGDYYILCRWFPGFKDKDFSKVYVLERRSMSNYPKQSVSFPNLRRIYGEAFYENENIQKVEFSANLKSIPSNCFYGCKNLKEVDMAGVERIGEGALKNTKINHIVFPETFKKFDGDPGLVDMNTTATFTFLGQLPPECPFNAFHKRNNDKVKIIVPDGRINAYKRAGWDGFFVIDSKTKLHYIYNLDKPGKIRGYLTQDIIPNVESIKISGHIDDKDFDVLTRCEHLRSLDLEDCYISESIGTAQERKSLRQTSASLLSKAINEASRKAANDYKYGNGDLGVAIMAEALADAVTPVTSIIANCDELQINESCIFPCNDEFDYYWCRQLDSLILPRWLGTVNLRYFTDLKYLKLPEYATDVYVGAHGEPFRIDVSKNLEELELEGRGLIELDLSKTNTRTIKVDDSSIKLFKGTPYLDKVSLSMARDGKAYFYTKEKPNSFDLKGCGEVHIPRGCKADWVTASGDGRIYIDDIELEQ